jgi:hypothetical protein
MPNALHETQAALLPADLLFFSLVFSALDADLDFAFAVVSGVVPSLAALSLNFCSIFPLARSFAFLRLSGLGMLVTVTSAFFALRDVGRETIAASALVGSGDAGSVSFCSCAGPWNEASPSSP